MAATAGSYKYLVVLWRSHLVCIGSSVPRLDLSAIANGVTDSIRFADGGFGEIHDAKSGVFVGERHLGVGRIRDGPLGDRSEL